MCLRCLLTSVMRWLSRRVILAILIRSCLILRCRPRTSRLCLPLACRSDRLTPVTRRLSLATVLLSAPHTRTMRVLIIRLMFHVSLAMVRVTFLPTRFVCQRTSLRRRLRSLWARSFASFLCRCRRLTSDCKRLRSPLSEPVVLVESPVIDLRTPDTSRRPSARSRLTLLRSWSTPLRRLWFFLVTDVRSRSILSLRCCVAATASALAPDSCCERAPVRSVLAAATSPSILDRSEAMSARRCLLTPSSILRTLLSSRLMTPFSRVEALRVLFPPALAEASSPAMLRCSDSLLDASREDSSWIVVLSVSSIVDSLSLRPLTLPSTRVVSCCSRERMPASASSTRPPRTSDAFCSPALSSACTLLWSMASWILSFWCAAERSALASSRALRREDSELSVLSVRIFIAALSDDTDCAREACRRAACDASDEASCCLAAASSVSVWLICPDRR
mmetsp:Transcript_20683/g.52141  ORF Transcript_20683/g.52141 Transcript_20683/m.52141 type:complete len:449 (+) Transcript_20683:412-1758(+)